jgi:plasmid stabilization system protein ParE
VTTYRVELSPEALSHAMRIASWWQSERPGAANRFREELEAAVRQLEGAPRAGRVYSRSHLALRRLLMPRTRYHVYYTVEDSEALVRVHAVWHASRGHGPPL